MFSDDGAIAAWKPNRVTKAFLLLLRHRRAVGLRPFRLHEWLSEQGRVVNQRVESLTDDLATKPYESLDPGELDELMADLEPLATLLLAAQDCG
ncbi:MAG TPA: hypothetical protein VFY45_10550 [Baekduia sp.]|nr:hypothetical protein [Baekduia sp.]